MHCPASRGVLHIVRLFCSRAREIIASPRTLRLRAERSLEVSSIQAKKDMEMLVYLCMESIMHFVQRAYFRHMFTRVR